MQEKSHLFNTSDDLSVMVLDELCITVYRDNLLAGWWDQADNPLVVPTKIALVHSELSEALEAHRKDLMDDKLPHHPGIAVELADAVIRILDLCGHLDIKLGSILAEKAKFNATRADHKPENRQVKGGKKY